MPIIKYPMIKLLFVCCRHLGLSEYLNFAWPVPHAQTRNKRVDGIPITDSVFGASTL